jgi:hypothetical protein
MLAEVNARIGEVASRSAADSEDWEFVCECGEPGCDERVLLTLAAYAAVRETGAAVLAHGHARG